MDRAELERLSRAADEVRVRWQTRTDGGPGSGHWGHRGVPGVHGGSAPGGGAWCRKAAPGGGYTSSAKEWRRKVEEAKNAPSMQRHQLTAAELKTIPLCTRIKVHGNGFSGRIYYSDGAGGIRNSKGERMTAAELKKAGAEVTYMPPLYREPAVTESSAVKAFGDGRVKPDRKVEMYCQGLSAKMYDGAVVTGEDGRQYLSKDGKWQETGPMGVRVKPKTLPVTAAGNRDMINGTISQNLYGARLQSKGLGAVQTRRLEEFMKNAPPKLRDAYTKTLAGCAAEGDLKKRGAYFSPGEGRVHFRAGETSAEVILHEYAHAMDYLTARGNAFGPSPTAAAQKLMTGAAYRQDYASVVKEVGLQVGPGRLIKGSLTEVSTSCLKWGREALKDVSRENRVLTMDVLDAVTEGDIHGMYSYGGHATSYWKGRSGGVGSQDPRITEGWAEFASLTAQNDQAALKVLERTVPNFYRALKAGYEEMLGEESG